jgi:methionyl-tRNA formyltransferase
VLCGRTLLDATELGDDLEGAIDRELAGIEIDLVVSWFWTRRLPERWLAAARLGGIGVHPSLLPRHRGPNPFFGAIDCGDAWTGVSVHRLEPEYDTGDVLEQLAVPVGTRDSWQLARALDAPSLCALRAVVSRAGRGAPLEGRAQDERAASWAPEPQGELLRADFRWPTERVLRRIRALAPVPGLPLEIRGVPFFVTRASGADCPSALEPGEAAVLGEPPSRIVVRTADGGIGLDSAVIGEMDDPLEGQVVGAEELARVVALRRTTVLD